MSVIAGVNKKDFFPTRKINKITTLGLSGRPGTHDGWDYIKRPGMMKNIALNANISSETSWEFTFLIKEFIFN